jgi:Ankyrin repeats (3 copies)/MYND finger
MNIGFFIGPLKFLLENGCPPDVQDICRYTALSHATEIPEDNADLARILIAHGANVNHPDIYGMTPIFQAVMSAHSKAVDVLMEGGADLDITDADGSCIRNTYIRCGPKVTAVIHAWERRRSGEKVPLGEKGCAVCGKDGKLLFCSACHSIRYCSSECQSMWATLLTQFAR